uniref:Cytoplasmic activation/proliferation-associated protein-1 C term domain-containing protein n=1 Tax=Hucho hucho TaxID=62062 RepID=A0A4W5JXG5_9TELE
MQVVFNLNAHVPPTNEALKRNHFPRSCRQGFCSQAEYFVEQPDIQQDALQSEGFHNQDQDMSSAVSHQEQLSQGPGFGRPGQSIYLRIIFILTVAHKWL